MKLFAAILACLPLAASAAGESFGDEAEVVRTRIERSILSLLDSVRMKAAATGTVTHVGGLLEPLGPGQGGHLGVERGEQGRRISAQAPTHGIDELRVGVDGDIAVAGTGGHPDLSRGARTRAGRATRHRGAAPQRDRGLDGLGIRFKCLGTHP